MRKTDIIEQIREEEQLNYRQLGLRVGNVGVKTSIHSNNIGLDMFIRIINAMGWRVFVVKRDGRAIEVEREYIKESL